MQCITLHRISRDSAFFQPLRFQAKLQIWLFADLRVSNLCSIIAYLNTRDVSVVLAPCDIASISIMSEKKNPVWYFAWLQAFFSIALNFAATMLVCKNSKSLKGHTLAFLDAQYVSQLYIWTEVGLLNYERSLPPCRSR